MADRLLIIVTRMVNEFEPYWDADIRKFECKGANYSKPMNRKISEDKLIIVDGSDLKIHRLNDLLACANLSEMVSNAGIIGIISHGIDINLSDFDSTVHEKVFTKKYGSEKLGKDFCDSENSTFVANEDPAKIRTGVLDAFRDALVFDKSEDIISDTFNNLWKFFHNDNILESKVRVLHACLTPAGAEKVAEIDGFGQLENQRVDGVLLSEYIKNNFSSRDIKDCMKEDYIEPLAKMRDVLLEI